VLGMEDALWREKAIYSFKIGCSTGGCLRGRGRKVY
jgi:hypothetical protein